ncbi:hypothetical protein [Parafilimonas terrae]|nr:hypothetical protein [Parafilimonas terrae]
MRKKLILPVLFILFCAISHAQSLGWMMGTWKGTGGIIQIDDVSGGSFSGTKTSGINNHKITTAISGAFRGRGLYLEDGEVLRGEGQPTSQGYDCSACTPVTKIVIKQDSLVLVNSISNCDEKCNGETFFYRLLTEYDSATQRYLVDRFGRPSDIIGFRPRRPQEDIPVASNDNNEPLKNDVVPNAAINDAAEKEKRIKDSLDNIARIRQQQIKDSTLFAQQKKRDKEITDSLNLAKQKEQQRIQDLLDNVARIRQQQIADSILLAQKNKRQQEITDSLNLAKQKEQQRIQDSLDNVARIRQQQIADSIVLAQQKKREKEIADSLNLVQQKEQQRIQDSLDNVARIRQQQINDSTLLAQQKRRQQQIADSLAAVHKQQYADSLQQAALAKTVPPSAADSSSSGKALTTRTNVLLGTYHITSPDILIELFDNAEIDGDRVSVYHNDTLIVSNEMLDKKPITLNIHADTASREHEFVLVAENLGSIPPNSALMRITAGKQSYRLSVKTDMKTNARIVFYYDGK